MCRRVTGDGGENVQQVAGGSRQPVEPRHGQHVTGSKLKNTVRWYTGYLGLGLGAHHHDLRVDKAMALKRLSDLLRLLSGPHRADLFMLQIDQARTDFAIHRR
jgi:hypothetical protein